MMKRLLIYGLVLSTAILFMACRGQKEGHSYGSDTHTHDIASHTQNDYFGSFHLEDENFGTKTKVTLTANSRIMVTNSLPNHVTGKFPNSVNPNTISAQNRTFNFPLHPKYIGKAEWIREPGIALNGVKFEPGTAEVVVCETGENYRLEAFQEVINLGLDFNNAHVQPTGAYHYHGTPTGVVERFDAGEDLVHIGFAHDGFPMYYSKKGAYKPSYEAVGGEREVDDCTYENPMQTIDVSIGGHHDGTFTSDFEFVEGSGDLDECNGITIDSNYIYLITNEFPYISRCLMGEFEAQERRGPDGRPNIDQLFEQMDVDKDGKLSFQGSKGPLKQDFSKIDANADRLISKEELENEMPQRLKLRRRQ